MENKQWWWASLAMFLLLLLGVFVIIGINEVKNLETCQQLRIRPFTEQFFTWSGILELNQKGEYQPKCI